MVIAHHLTVASVVYSYMAYCGNKLLVKSFFSRNTDCNLISYYGPVIDFDVEIAVCSYNDSESREPSRADYEIL